MTLRVTGNMARTREAAATDIRPEDLVGPEWAERYAMTPAERMRVSGKLWATFLGAWRLY